MSKFDPQRFSAAWNAHDIEAIMAMSSEDCEFWASAGPTPSGKVSRGQAQVRAAYLALFATFPDGQWTNGRAVFLSPERVLAEWRFVASRPDGSKLEVDGLDLLDLVGDKVRIKNSFRKSVG